MSYAYCSISFEILNNDLGILHENNIVKFNNAQYYPHPGSPAIPKKQLSFILPQNTDLQSISLSISEEIDGEVFNNVIINPVPPLRGKNGEQFWSENRTIINGRDMSIYSSDTFFPKSPIGRYTIGELRGWQIITIEFFPYAYNPKSQVLKHISTAKLHIQYDTTPNYRLESNDYSSYAKNILSSVALNYSTYETEFTKNKRDRVWTYVILTSEAIQKGSKKLQQFIKQKESRGYMVKQFTESQWNGGTGDVAAEKIRQWLKNNTKPMGIDFVLLIGDPRQSGTIPMKMSWPHGNYQTPTDFYYAELSGNWDLNGNGRFGESEEYGKPGGADRFAEITVGRIPFYGNFQDLDSILEKTMKYENELHIDIKWRKNILIPVEPLSQGAHTHTIGEVIKNNYAIPSGWKYHRVYNENFGLNPETYPCNEDNVVKAWVGDKFGVVIWFTHGWAKGAVEIMSTEKTSLLDNNFPVHTFQSSCENAYPEFVDNLAYSLLINGAITTIGATRVSWFTSDLTTPQTCPGMAANYAKKIIKEGRLSGIALNELRSQTDPGGGGFWMNWLVFNLFGCPTLGTGTCTESMPADSVYWKFDEFEGSKWAKDSYGSKHGIFEGKPTLAEPGKKSGSIYLDGDSDYVTIPPLYLNSNNATITAWIKRHGPPKGGWTGIVHSRSVSTIAGIALGTQSELRYSWNNKHWDWNSGLIIPNNKWTFVALVIEPTKATLYLDNNNAIRTTSHNREEFEDIGRIGHDQNQNTAKFKGHIDDVHIYNRSLSPSEIKKLYDDASALKLISLNGGEQFKSGEIAKVYWNSINISMIDIQYTPNIMDSVVQWIPIIKSIDASLKEYVWNIPNNLKSTKTYGIKISDSKNYVTNVQSVKPFSIVNNSTSITNKTPNIDLIQGVRIVPNPINLRHYKKIQIIIHASQNSINGMFSVYTATGKIIYSRSLLDCIRDKNTYIHTWNLMQDKKHIFEPGAYLLVLKTEDRNGIVDYQKKVFGIKK